MKTTKLVLLGFLGIFTLFAAVGCTEQSVLDQFIKVANDVESSSVSYSEESLSSEDGIVSETSLEVSEYSIVQLSETSSDLIAFQELRLEILDLHDQIVVQREAIQALMDSIRTQAQAIKDAGYVLLEDDMATLQQAIDDLTGLRENLRATEGQAYQRIFDLRGSYTRENLPQIITVYTEVIDVLEYRMDLFTQAIEILQNADVLLSDYLES